MLQGTAIVAERKALWQLHAIHCGHKEFAAATRIHRPRRTTKLDDGARRIMRFALSRMSVRVEFNVEALITVKTKASHLMIGRLVSIVVNGYRGNLAINFLDSQVA